MNERDRQEGPALMRETWERNRCGRVALSWSLAGGILAGGCLLLSVSLSATASSSAAPGAVGVLFVLGALAGLVHGGILGYLARGGDRGRMDALKSLGLGALLLVLLSPVAWFVALHLALTIPFWARGFLPMIGVTLSWVVGAGLCLWALLEGWTGLKRAFARWPERRLGALILTAVLAVLAVRFVLNQPALWGTDVQVKGLGAIILALGATLWIALPVVLALLHGAHRLFGGGRSSHRHAAPGSSTPGS